MLNSESQLSGSVFFCFLRFTTFQGCQYASPRPTFTPSLPPGYPCTVTARPPSSTAPSFVSGPPEHVYHYSPTLHTWALAVLTPVQYTDLISATGLTAIMPPPLTTIDVTLHISCSPFGATSRCHSVLPRRQESPVPPFTIEYFDQS